MKVQKSEYQEINKIRMLRVVNKKAKTAENSFHKGEIGLSKPVDPNTESLKQVILRCQYEFNLKIKSLKYQKGKFSILFRIFNLSLSPVTLTCRLK